MQEEKKNEQTGETKKEKQPRRRGYFIEPPTAEKRTQDTAHPKQGNAKNAQNGKPKQHAKNTQNSGNKAEKSNQAQVAAEPQNPTQGDNQANSSNTRKKKNYKHKNKPKPQENAQEPAPAAPQAQQTAPKSAKRPTNEVKKRTAETAKPVITHSADDYEEYTLTVEDENVSNSKISADDESAPKTEVVGIRFKSSGKVYYFNPCGKSFKRGTCAIVDTARGQEFGDVAMSNTLVKSADIVLPLRQVIRTATAADIEHHKENKKKEDEAFKICNEKISEHKLDMKLIDAQYTFDNTKLLFYFTSTNRVDFRELVKDLASVFRTRIELRQIGIRDEAKIIGGLGICGRPLCCTLFLSDFDQVSIKMAKEQNLSLNSSKISGVCGRLMCCLKYEHEAYEYEIKRTPPVDSIVRTENGDGIVTEISPLRGTVKVRLLASPEVPPKTYKRDDVTMLRKKQNTDKK